LQSGGRTEQVLAALLSSEEYFQRQGGTNQRWLDQVYIDLLGRARDASSQPLLDGLNNRTSSRSQVAAAVLGSDEYRLVLVRTVYQDYLKHPPTGDDISVWLPPLRQGVTEIQFRVAVLVLL
jgi:hypothetical protein